MQMQFPGGNTGNVIKDLQQTTILDNRSYDHYLLSSMEVSFLATS